MKILCHICCAQCFLGAEKSIRESGYALEGLFYNPNIQPFIEFRRRLKSVRVLQEQLKFPLHVIDEYEIGAFLGLVAFRQEAAQRCPLCYRMRLYRTAQFARANGFDAFTTTLLVSIHQDHDRVAQIGREAGEDAGIEFHRQDFRAAAKVAHDEAKRRKLYLQSYCGCVFSEYERYKDTTKELYKGPNA